MNSVEISGFIPKLGLVVVGIVLAECTRQGLNYLQAAAKSKWLGKWYSFMINKLPVKTFSIQSKAVRGFAAISATQQLASGLGHNEFFVCWSMTVKDNLYFIPFLQCRQLLSHIKSARKSIDIAVYCISCFEIADVVLERHKVGVRVRLITDQSMESWVPESPFYERW